MLCIHHGIAVVAILLAQKQHRTPLSFIRIVVYTHKEDDMQHVVGVTAWNRREGGLPG